MLNTTTINSGALLGLTVAVLVAVPNPINAHPINTAPLLKIGRHLVANNAKPLDGFINANTINSHAINTGGAIAQAVFIPPVPLSLTTINALPLNTTRLLIDVPYSPKPRQIAPLTIGGSMILPTLPSPATPRFVASFETFNKSLIYPAAEPYQLSIGYRAQAKNDTGETMALPLTSMSINTALDGVERVAETTPRYIIGGIAQLIGGMPHLGYGTVASYDVNVYNMVNEQINIYTPYTIDLIAWLGTSTGLQIDVIEMITMSDGTIVERLRNTMLTDIAVSYDVGVHSATITIRGKNRYRHPTWRSLEYHVDYDFNSSYGVISWRAPHVIEYPAGADEGVLVNSYNLNGASMRCQGAALPSQVGIGAIVDGIRIIVKNIQEGHSENADNISFTGTIG